MIKLPWRQVLKKVKQTLKGQFKAKTFIRVKTPCSDNDPNFFGNSCAKEVREAESQVKYQNNLEKFGR